MNKETKRTILAVVLFASVIGIVVWVIVQLIRKSRAENW